jgi:hypothetical protein
MIIKEEKTRTNRSGITRNETIFNIDAEEISKEFRDEVDLYLDLFRREGPTERVLDFFEKIPEIKGMKVPGLIFSDDSIYVRFIGNGIPFKENPLEALQFDLYNKRPLNKIRNICVKNLSAIVLDNNLSLGSKKIIKDIALNTLEYHISRAMGGDPEYSHLTSIVRLDNSMVARQELKKYGFKTRNKVPGLTYNTLNGKVQEVYFFD